MVTASLPKAAPKGAGYCTKEKERILMITAIAAVSENWGIGKDNDLLFNIPEDKKFFRRTTLHHTIIMGRKTMQSLPNGKPFKDRSNIILSRDKSFTCDGAEICRSVEEVLEMIKGREKVFVVGGGAIYRDMLPYCDNAVITKVDGKPDADVFFPNLDEDPNWLLMNTSDDHEFEGLRFRYCIYEKK